VSERPFSPASDPPEPTHCHLCGDKFSALAPRHKHHRDCCTHCIREKLLSIQGIDMTDRRPWIDQLYAAWLAQDDQPFDVPERSE